MKIQSSSQNGRHHGNRNAKGPEDKVQPVTRKSCLKLGDDAYCGSVVSGNQEILMRMDKTVLLMTLGDPIEI